MNYQVGDFIIRLKNAAMARRRKVALSYSKMNKSIGQVLVKERFLESIKEEEVEGKKALTAVLRYEKREPVLSQVSIISKPSLRVYIKAEKIAGRERKKSNILILSTNQGVMAGVEASKKGLGGEVLFEIS